MKLSTQPCILGESPHWDAPTETLYWVDIYGKKIFQYQINQNRVHTFDLPEMVGHVIPTASTGLMISMPSGIYKFMPENQDYTKICDLEPQRPNNRPNDGKCDPEGRLWVGTIDLDFKPGASSLYRLNQDNTLTQVLDGLTLANGLAWDTKNNIFYFIDSSKASVLQFDYHPETGDITNQKVAFNFHQSLGLPDGMCITPEGMLWIAGFNGGHVSLFNPLNGKILKQIKLPTPYPTACVLGGKNLDQLFITTSSHLLTPKARKKENHAGFTYQFNV